MIEPLGEPLKHQCIAGLLLDELEGREWGSWDTMGVRYLLIWNSNDNFGKVISSRTSKLSDWEKEKSHVFIA